MAGGILAKLLPSPEALAGMITPDMVTELMQSLGFNPAQIMAEVEAFKAGAQQTLLHFNARLNTIEARQGEMVAQLQRIEDILSRLVTDNCVRVAVREDTHG